MPTRALSGARMVRDLGVTNEFLAPNVAAANKIQQVGSDRLLGRDIRSSGTGNTQQVQPWYDVQVPDWTTGAHITNWSTLQYYLSSVAQTNRLVPASANFISFFGSMPNGGGASQVNGGVVLHPNGNIYVVPNDTDAPNTIINPVNLTTTTYAIVGGPVNKRAYYGGALAPNGKIYIAPLQDTVFRYIDPTTNTIPAYATVTGLLGGGISNAFMGSVLAPNGKIYFVPNESSLCYCVDPSNNSLQSFGTFAPITVGSNNAAQTGVLAPNGKIYTIPGTTSRMYVIDPSNNTVSSLATFFPSSVAGDNTSQGGVLGIDGKIYFGWSGGRQVFVVDPINNNVETFGTFTETYISGVLAPDGRIYLSPSNSANISVIDPESKTVTKIPQTIVSTANFNAYWINTPNRMIISNAGYLIGTNQSTAVDKLFNVQWNINVCTNPMFNNKL